jgi:hypothetical protein
MYLENYTLKRRNQEAKAIDRKKDIRGLCESEAKKEERQRKLSKRQGRNRKEGKDLSKREESEKTLSKEEERRRQGRSNYDPFS